MSFAPGLSGAAESRLRFLEVDDLEPSDLLLVLDYAERPAPASLLDRSGVALLFEKPSARTRNATEMAVVQLGGHPVTIRDQEVGITSGRESVEDLAQVLACYHRIIAARVFDHMVLERMVAALSAAGIVCPVVNLLSDWAHPCQALADLLTFRQAKGSFHGRSMAYVGDANNVCRSLATGGAMVGLDVRIAAPEGYGFSDEEMGRFARIATESGHGGRVVLYDDPREAVSGADAVYTDVWTSMGQESEREVRLDAFRGFTVDPILMSHAAEDAIFLHCLPAHRGEEVSADVIDGPASRVFKQAENRMHSVRGLLMWMVS